MTCPCTRSSSIALLKRIAVARELVITVKFSMSSNISGMYMIEVPTSAPIVMPLLISFAARLATHFFSSLISTIFLRNSNSRPSFLGAGTAPPWIRTSSFSSSSSVKSRRSVSGVISSSFANSVT